MYKSIKIESFSFRRSGGNDTQRKISGQKFEKTHHTILYTHMRLIWVDVDCLQFFSGTDTTLTIAIVDILVISFH